MSRETLVEWFTRATEQELRDEPRLKEQIMRLLGELRACRNRIKELERVK